jgi:hypothetical protein
VFDLILEVLRLPVGLDRAEHEVCAAPDLCRAKSLRDSCKCGGFLGVVVSRELRVGCCRHNRG